MKSGVYYTRQDEILGVNVADEGNECRIVTTFNNVKELQNVKHPVIGFPLDNFIVKTVKLPKLKKDELKKAVDLQIEFLLGEEAYNAYLVNTKLLSQSNSSILFIVAAKVSEEVKKIKKTVILPDTLGVYIFALKEKILDDKKTTMLVYTGRDYTHLVVVYDSTIVFMRSFSSKSDINSEIKLSEQAVYLQSERCFVNIDKFVIFYIDESIKRKIDFNNNSNISWKNVSKYIVNGKELFLPVGLSQYEHSIKSVSYWNVAKKPPTTIESLKRSIIWIMPILLFFLPLYYYGDYYQDQKSINILKNEIKQINDQVSDVDLISRKVSDADNLLNDYAGPCLEYAKFYNLLVLINKFRPKEVWLTNISGKISGEMIVTGYSKNFSDISILIKQLNSSGFIKTLNLNYSNASSVNKVNFQMTIILTENYDFIIEEIKDVQKDVDSDSGKIPEDSMKQSKLSETEKKENLEGTEYSDHKKENKSNLKRVIGTEN